MAATPGGNMERPGLQQLLVDVAAGKVDIIVVYKIDRLTPDRSRTSRGSMKYWTRTTSPS